MICIRGNSSLIFCACCVCSSESTPFVVASFVARVRMSVVERRRKGEVSRRMVWSGSGESEGRDMVGVQYSTMYGRSREEDTKKKRGRDEEGGCSVPGCRQKTTSHFRSTVLEYVLSLLSTFPIQLLSDHTTKRITN